MQDSDVPKYKKKSNPKTPKKSNHKHDYAKEVLLKQTDTSGTLHYAHGKICTICNKVMPSFLFESEKCEVTGLYRQLSLQEILEKYKHLEMVEVDWKTGDLI